MTRQPNRHASPYQLLFDRALTRVDPERAHSAAFRAIRAAHPVTGMIASTRSRSPVRRGGAKFQAMGLSFPGRLGLAAGFDKNAVGIDALSSLGFGFVEVGTVTGEPQPGNPRPRLFRLPTDRAIVNRMGFNNDGAETVARRLEDRARRLGGCNNAPPRRSGGATMRRLGVPLGINIGKTKAVPEDDQAAVLADYAKSTRLLAPYADYLVVNVSSPNTPGLRDLQVVERLEPLLEEVRRCADRAIGDSRERPVPLLVKIAPDLDDDGVLAIADLALSVGLDGIIATNTTVSRSGLASSADEVAGVGAGGLSGAPLRDRSTQVVAMLRERVGSGLVLIGAGGICSEQDALDRVAAGADLVQAYTGFVYGGPSWPRRVNRVLARAPERAAERAAERKSDE